MSYLDATGRPDVATAWVADRVMEQRAAHDARLLRTWAEGVLGRLPAGRLTLLSTSVEGCALAAVIGALRDEPTTWEQLALGRPQEDRDGGGVVVVEVVRLGDGLLEALDALLPGVPVIHDLAASPALASAA
jgi:hypothetical protein